MLTRFALSLVLLSAAVCAADEKPPTLRADPVVDKAIFFKVTLLRDTHDPTLTQVMVQIDRPPAPMAFDVTIRFGGKTLPVGPMAWNKIQWWAYDVDIPVGITSADLVFTANPAAVRKLQLINPFAVHGLSTIWDGTVTLNNVKVTEQNLAGMGTYAPPNLKLLPHYFADELIGESEVLDRFRRDFNVSAAQEALEKLVRENPHDAVALYNLGCIVASQSDWPRAVELLATARDLKGSPVADQSQHQLRLVGGWVTDLAQRERNVDAMFTLATIYDKGWGPSRDIRKAKLWYRNAANVGDSRAKTRLIVLDSQDHEVAADLKAEPSPVASATDGANGGSSPAEYSAWVAENSEKSLGRQLLVMKIVGEARTDRPSSTFIFTISDDGTVWARTYGPFGSKGQGGSRLAPDLLKRIEEACSRLPRGTRRLPPPERRLLIQTRNTTEVYDRAELPEAVTELIRLSGSSIGGWRKTFVPRSKMDIGISGPLVLIPHEKRILCGTQMFTLPAFETLGDFAIRSGSNDVVVSPDGSIAAVSTGGECHLVDLASLKISTVLYDPGKHDDFFVFQNPCFTSDGQYLIFPAKDGLKVFDVKSGKHLAPLPQIPRHAIQWKPSKSWQHAVMRGQTGAVSLWDATTQAARELDPVAPLLDAVFSPDESQVAVVTSDKNGYSNPRLRIFQTASGQLVHELRVNELGCDRLRLPRWSADGRYVLAITKPSTFWTDENISVWSVKTGRHRADFISGSGIFGYTLLPGDDRLIASIRDGQLCLWNFAEAIRQVREFEASLTTSIPATTQP